MVVKITRDGRIRLPSGLREKWADKTVEIVEKDGKLIITPAEIKIIVYSE